MVEGYTKGNDDETSCSVSANTMNCYGDDSNSRLPGALPSSPLEPTPQPASSSSSLLSSIVVLLRPPEASAVSSRAAGAVGLCAPPVQVQQASSQMVVTGLSATKP